MKGIGEIDSLNSCRTLHFIAYLLTENLNFLTTLVGTYCFTQISIAIPIDDEV